MRLGIIAAAITFAATPALAQVDMNALYDAAKKEGALNIYGGGPQAPYRARIARFEQQFPGIKVNFVNGPSNVLSERIDKARKDGKPEADAAFLQTIQDYVAWKKAGVLIPFKFDAWDLIPASFKDPDGMFSAHSLIMIAYAHRTGQTSRPAASRRQRTS
jgi:ABC-type glycerol-3-phosphate transport system substrate-binding protein